MLFRSVLIHIVRCKHSVLVQLSMHSMCMFVCFCALYSNFHMVSLINSIKVRIKSNWICVSVFLTMKNHFLHISFKSIDYTWSLQYWNYTIWNTTSYVIGCLGLFFHYRKLCFLICFSIFWFNVPVRIWNVWDTHARRAALRMFCNLLRLHSCVRKWKRKKKIMRFFFSFRSTDWHLWINRCQSNGQFIRVCRQRSVLLVDLV